ncbi:MAG: dTDP-4-dehydrorhamnose reductase [Motiliproteus sp.]
MKILLTGANGQVGRCVQDRAKNCELFAFTREQLDITDCEQLDDVFAEVVPDVVINAAAYTAVDKAEEEVDLAYAINATGPANLAKICQRQNIPLLHISTDYVFDGTENTPYVPEAETSPLGVYGASKLAGEDAVRAIEKHIVVRTAWVFSEYGNNFVKTMLRLGKERDQLSVVEDQIGCPTYAGHIAEILLALANKVVNPGFKGWGTYHFCGDEVVSWYQFAQAIFSQASAQGLLPKVPAITAIPSTEYPTPAARPGYSVLDNQSLLAVLETAVERDWHKGLSSVLARL